MRADCDAQRGAGGGCGTGDAARIVPAAVYRRAAVGGKGPGRVVVVLKILDDEAAGGFEAKAFAAVGESCGIEKLGGADDEPGLVQVCICWWPQKRSLHCAGVPS